MGYEMRRICMICKKDMGTKPCIKGQEKFPTHGLCPECADKDYKLKKRYADLQAGLEVAQKSNNVELIRMTELKLDLVRDALEDLQNKNGEKP